MYTRRWRSVGAVASRAADERFFLPVHNYYASAPLLTVKQKYYRHDIETTVSCRRYLSSIRCTSSGNNGKTIMSDDGTARRRCSTSLSDIVPRVYIIIINIILYITLHVTNMRTCFERSRFSIPTWNNRHNIMYTTLPILYCIIPYCFVKKYNYS